MRRVALVFVLAVFVPSLALAWLAVRSLRDQQFVLERQQALLYQGTADALVKAVEAYIAERQREFGLHVETLLTGGAPSEVAAAFDNRLRATWTLAQVGFVVSLDGNVLAPSLYSRPEAKDFRLQNDRFLCNQESVEVYWQNSLIGNALAQMPEGQLASNQIGSGPPALQSENQQLKTVYAKDANFNKGQKRSVTPQQQQAIAEPEGYSKVAAAEAEFRQLVGDSAEGRIARFLQDKLHLLLWYRSPRDPQLVFGAQLDVNSVKQGLKSVVQIDRALARDVCVALLDDRAQLIASSHPGFQANWRRPFVASEVGEALPHWEAAVYLLDPTRLQRSARTLRFTIGSLVALLVAAIAFGGWLVVQDLRRQLAVAKQKTDFVSNVSHELKTPLTSIRMFSELLADGRVTDAPRQKQFLQIISAEAARLTRLINNVLDFARPDRRKYNMTRCDLAAVVRDILDTYRPHLESAGFKLEATLPLRPVLVNGDCDALSQIVLNLVSNAEKYSGAEKSIAVEVENGDCTRIHVMDRGLGVPRGCEQRIFEQFYRAHDSLSSGIQGSGLGLTLARQIARAHGGDVTYQAREGGGSRFTLTLPNEQEQEQDNDCPESPK
jgi:signal transduction histidine kinase